MKLKLNIILSFLFLLQIFPAIAQDVTFSQFYSNPVYLNPAFAGAAEVPRMAIQHRSQWHSFNNAFSTHSISFDTPLKKINSGFGLLFFDDALADNILNQLQVNMIYTVFIRLNETFRLNGGIQAGFRRNSLNADKLIFNDNLDSYFGNHGISAELQYLGDPNHSFLDFSTGVLVYNKQLFFGAAAHHLAEPNQSFFEGSEKTDKLYRRYTFHFGARLPVHFHGQYRKSFDVSPQLVYNYQGGFQQISYGALAAKSGFTLGAWFRQNIGLQYDAVILSAGFIQKRWQLAYSYDFDVSGIWGQTGGTSEICLSFLLKNIDNRPDLPFYNGYEQHFGN